MGVRMNPERKRLIGAKGTEKVDYILVKTYCQNKKKNQIKSNKQKDYCGAKCLR